MTVTLPPAPGCSLTSGTPTVASKQVKWPITNTGSTKVTIEQLSLMWPQANGKLMKVKFDGDTIYDPDWVWSAGGTTLNSGDFVTDLKKKSLDPGKTRVLILEFEKNAVMDLVAVHADRQLRRGGGVRADDAEHAWRAADCGLQRPEAD